MIKQERQVTPPIEADSKLVDYSSIVQKNFQDLFGVAHVHVGPNGVLATAPLATSGAVGDIVIVNTAGVVTLYIKVAATQWYHLGPAIKG
jgi:hypothetical protein